MKGLLWSARKTWFTMKIKIQFQGGDFLANKEIVIKKINSLRMVYKLKKKLDKERILVPEL
jgi:hypothetical protein